MISTHGLDLSFMKANPLPPREAPRERRSQAHLFRGKRSSIACPYFMPDVDAAYGGAWKSIVDGTEISSRTNRREHDKRNDVINVGNDFWPDDSPEYFEKKMGYDPSLIGPQNNDDVQFGWK